MDSKVQMPTKGKKITISNNQLIVPDNPIIPFIEGDGIGSDIWSTSVNVFDQAVKLAYGGNRKIEWLEIFADRPSYRQGGQIS